MTPELHAGPTHVRGLLEFSRPGCGHFYLVSCADCTEFASRAEIATALQQVDAVIAVNPRPTTRIGQTVLDAEDLRYLARRLDEFDANARGIAS